DDLSPCDVHERRVLPHRGQLHPSYHAPGRIREGHRQDDHVGLAEQFHQPLLPSKRLHTPFVDRAPPERDHPHPERLDQPRRRAAYPTITNYPERLPPEEGDLVPELVEPLVLVGPRPELPVELDDALPRCQ